jgi:putative transposase
MMDPMYAPNPKCRDLDYIDFLIASPKAFRCTEAAKVQPESPDAPAHDAFTRLLHRLEPDPATLWDEARPMVHRKGGTLVLDDSTWTSTMPRRSSWSPATGRASTSGSSGAST